MINVTVKALTSLNFNFDLLLRDHSFSLNDWPENDANHGEFEDRIPPSMNYDPLKVDMGGFACDDRMTRAMIFYWLGSLFDRGRCALYNAESMPTWATRG